MARVDIYNLKQWLSMAWQSGYSAVALSRKLEVSRRQLHRYTRELFGCSPQQWMDTHRMICAAGMLRKHRCVKTVAFQLGFKQVSHFSREFRLHNGISPTEFLEWNDREQKKNELEKVWAWRTLQEPDYVELAS